MIDTPVAFLIFNRPDLTQIVFDAIAQARPKKLLVVADGPRFPEEAEKCAQARAIIEQVDWECEVLTNFSDVNLGCKRRVSSGLDWVFSLVEEAIILEDDCLPHPTFFDYCAELLARYRDDERIMMISGDNFQAGQRRTPHSYYFSYYADVWGWACWRRSWNYYDVEMKKWTEYKRNWSLPFQDDFEKEYWQKIFDDTSANQIDTWDYQWFFSSLTQNGLSVVPEVNLVRNLGFRPDATHTTGYCAAIPTTVEAITEIIHPPFVIRHSKADTFTFEHRLEGGRLRREAAIDKVLLEKIKKRLRPCKHKLQKYIRGREPKPRT